MEPNYLSVEELNFELYIRGTNIEGNCDVKRAILRGHLQSEKCQPTSHPKVQVDNGMERIICIDKVNTLESMVNRFTFDKRHPDYKRLKSKLLHVKNRVNYLTAEYQTEADFKTELITKIMLLFDLLENKSGNVPGVNLIEFNDANDNVLSPVVTVNSPLMISEANMSSQTTASHQISVASSNFVPQTTMSLSNLNLQNNTGVDNFTSQNNQNVNILNSLYDPKVTTSNSQHNLNFSTHSNVNFCTASSQIINNVAPGTYQVSSSFRLPEVSSTNVYNNVPIPSRNVFHENISRTNFGPYSQNYNVNDINQFNTNFSTLPRHSTQLCNNVAFREPMGSSNQGSFVHGGLHNAPDATYNYPHVDHSKAFFRLSQSNRSLLKFDGRNQTLHNFLERVDEFCMSHKISKNDLLTFAHEFFEGDALILFRSVRSSCHTWQDLENQLKIVFLPCDFEGDLWDAIRDRKQGVSERVLIFIAVMENLFKRFSYPVNESTQLKIIIKNLRPYFQDRLALRYPFNISELKQLCKTLEDVKLSNSNFKESTGNFSNLLGPDLSFSKSNTSGVKHKGHINEILEDLKLTDINKSSAEVVGNINHPVSLPENSNIAINALKNIKCWNCDIQGHAYNQCPKKRTIFCFTCGKKGVTKTKCLKCSPKNEVTTDLRLEDAVLDLPNPTAP